MAINETHWLQKLLLCSYLIFAGAEAKAQITPDNTLGTESSRVTPNTLINGAIGDKIESGAQRGSNIFHSFSEFNIDNGQKVYFANPSGVVNILTRVTGGNASNILGTLGVDGAANLFLMNPNGILFGKNASLDVRGSFVGTTANAIQFGNQGVFSATNPQAPALLTIQPSALLFNQINQNAAIQNNSVAPAGKDPSGIDVYGVRVPNGKSLLLVGGNVSMDGGWLVANSGRIELGGLTEAGSVEVQSNEGNFSLSFPQEVQRGDIFLNNTSVVGVIGNGGGSITANARNLEILNGSELFGGIGGGLGITGTQAGEITINATGRIKLAGENTYIFNSVQPKAVGNAGNINIKTGSLEVINGAQINSFTRGQGNAGNIIIQAKDAVSFDGVDSNGFPSGSFSNVDTGGLGNGGTINIAAKSLSLTNGAVLGVDIRGASQTLQGGQGIGGNVNINVRDALTILGTNNSGIFAGLGAGAIGRGGDIKIEAGNLSVQDSGEISTSTSGKGDSGNISITVRDAISLDTAGIYNNVQFREAEGNAGNIDIITGSLLLNNGAQINSFTRGQGNAGNIIIKASGTVAFDGVNNNTGFPSALISNVDSGAVGNGGNINITAGSLSLTNGGELGVSVRQKTDTLADGQGIGGNVDINVRDALTISGTGNSGIFAGLGVGAIGRGGNIKIQAGNLSIQDSGEINSSTSGKGNSGNISITVRDAISLDTAGIYNSVQSRRAVGNAGDINIITGSLSLKNGAQINSFTRGQGNAGNITIQANGAVAFDAVNNNTGFSSALFSNVDSGAVGNGGNINITAASLSVTNGGKLVTDIYDKTDTLSGGQGIGGTLNINVRDALTISGKNSQISGSLGDGAIGRGGDIKIQAGNVFVKDGGEISSSTSGKGDAGIIDIFARDSFSLDYGTNNSYIFNNINSTGVGDARGINITTGSLSVTNGAQISSSISGRGNAGNITIQAKDINFDGLDANGFPSGVFSNVRAGGIGKGGNIDITAESLSLTNGGNLQVAIREASDQLSGGKGVGGNLNINVRNALTISGVDSDIFTDLDSGAEGRGGNINIQAGNIFIKDGAEISSNTSGKGDSGTISITARETVSLSGQAISTIRSNVNERGVGNSGGIIINTGSLFASDEAWISSSILGRGNSGGIFINARDTVSLMGVGDLNLGRNNFDADGTIFSSSVEFGGIGNSGDIVIKTGTLRLDSSQINTSTSGTGNSGNIIIEARDSVALLQGSDMFSEVTCACEPQGGGVGGIGNGGDIKITTGSFLLDIGANLRADTEAKGDGGNIIINARDSVTFKGDLNPYWGGVYTQVEHEAVGKGGDIIINTPNLSVSGLHEINTRTQGLGSAGNIFINAESISFAGSDVIVTSGASKEDRLPGTSGNGGDININTNSLLITEGAKLNANTEIDDAAGNININASRLTLDKKGSITSDSDTDANGGNINLQLSDLLLLRRGSQISTTAGTTQAGGNGGNININTRFIVADKRENSDISANAFSGKGGNVSIRAQGIFGIEARAKQSPLSSDITASSETGVQGQISITRPDIEPAQGLIELPEEVVDASNQIGQICPRGAYAKRPLGEFTITGRGSLPPSPLQPMTGSTSTLKLATLEQAPSVKQPNIISSPAPTSAIVEAQGWVKDADGSVMLVAMAPETTLSARSTMDTCQRYLK